MNEHQEDKTRHTRQSSSNQIRIRLAIRSGNVSPQKINLEEGGSRHLHEPEDMVSIFKKIPRTIEMQDNMLV